MQRPVFTLGGVRTCLYAQMNRHRLTLAIWSDAVGTYQVAIPLGAHLCADQRVRHRIKGTIDLDAAVGVQRAATDLEEAKRLGREWLQRGLLHFQKMTQHLLTRGAVDPHLGHGAVPALGFTYNDWKSGKQSYILGMLTPHELPADGLRAHAAVRARGSLFC